MNMKTTYIVIPAQAGIQQIEQSPRSGTIGWSCPLRGIIEGLDSGLRRNDEVLA